MEIDQSMKNDHVRFDLNQSKKTNKQRFEFSNSSRLPHKNHIPNLNNTYDVISGGRSASAITSRLYNDAQ